MKRTTLGILAILAALAVARWASPALAATPTAPTFPTPEAAFEALVEAAKAGTEARLVAVLGPGSRALVSSGDAVADKAALEGFVKAAEQRTFYHKQGADRVTVNIGFDNWPMPIPIVRKGDSWHFDAAAGEEEMLNRRIGRNERSTVDSLRAVVESQQAYYRDDLNGNGVMDYASRITSRPGMRDGLYWPASQGGPASPFGPFMARAEGEGYKAGSGSPYHGYYFRILTAQGRNARGGAYSYLANGRMVGGWAMVAWPARYGNSGVLTYMVNANGVIVSKNLGPDTDRTCRAMTAFDPDKTWAKVK